MSKCGNGGIYKLIIALPIAVLVACTSTADNQFSNYINAVKARVSTFDEPIPEFISLEKFVYPDEGVRRSPFEQIQVDKRSNTLPPNTSRPKQPLEAYPLEDLKFVGVLKQGSRVWGLISKTDGELARVKKGDYMGQNFGKIMCINDTALIVEERVQIDGTWEKKVTTFSLDASK
ncbi:MAG: pilus assembly protein PilP [Legionella sp.]|nr:pilus assembly protein PilP [Legionella sp.]